MAKKQSFEEILGSDFLQKLAEMDKALAGLVKESNNLRVTSVKLSKEGIEAMRKRLSELDVEAKKGQNTFSALVQEMKNYKQAVDGSNKGIDGLKAQIKGLKEELASLKKEHKEVTKESKSTEQSFLSLGTRFFTLATGVKMLKQIFDVLKAAMVASVTSAMEYEHALRQVEAISRATATELKLLDIVAQNLGASTEYTAVQVLGLQKSLSKLGFTTVEIVASTKAITDLATATGEELAESATVAAATLRGFDMDATEMTRVVDVMAGSFVRSGLDLSKFRESMKLVAPIARGANISLESTTAVLAKLADQGIHGSLAGTALRNIISNLTDESSKLSQFLGYTITDTRGFEQAMRDLSGSSEEVSDMLGLVDKRARSAVGIMIQNAVAVSNLTDEFEQLNGEAGAIATLMRTTFKNDLEIAKSALDALGRSVGNDTVPVLTKLTKAFTDQVTILRAYKADVITLAEAWKTLFSDQAKAELIFKVQVEAMEQELSLQESILQESKQQVAFIKENIKNYEKLNDEVRRTGVITDEYTAALKEAEEALGMQAIVTTKLRTATGEVLTLNMLNTAQMGFTLEAGEKKIKQTERSFVQMQGEVQIQQKRLELMEDEKAELDAQIKVDEKRASLLFAQVTTADLITENGKKYYRIIDDTGKGFKKITEEQYETLISDEKILRNALETNKLKSIELDLDQKLAAKKLENINAILDRNKISYDFVDETNKLEGTGIDIIDTKIQQLQRIVKLRMGERDVADKVAKDNSLDFAAQIQAQDELLDAEKAYLNAKLKLRIAEKKKELKAEHLKEADMAVIREAIRAEELEAVAKYHKAKNEIEAEAFKIYLEMNEQASQIEKDLKKKQIANDLLDIEAQIESRKHLWSFTKKHLHAQYLERVRIQDALSDEESKLAKDQLKRDFAAAKGDGDARVAAWRKYTARIKQIDENRLKERKEASEQEESDLAEMRESRFRDIQAISQQVVQLSGDALTFIMRKYENALIRINKWEKERMELAGDNADLQKQIENEAERRRIEIYRKQAKAEKAQTLFAATIQGSLAIAKAAATLNPVLIAAISALTAAQIATIAATPLPEFRKGTKNAPQGLAIVDEEGSELIYRKKRGVLEMSSGKNGARVTYLDKGDQVIPAHKTQALLNGDQSILQSVDQNISSSISKFSQPAPNQANNGIDQAALVKGIAQAVGQLPITEQKYDHRGYREYQKKDGLRIQRIRSQRLS